MKKFIIRYRSSIGQQLEGVFDTVTGKCRQQLDFSDGEFKATIDEADIQLARAKRSIRGAKWVRLYEVFG